MTVSGTGASGPRSGAVARNSATSRTPAEKRRARSAHAGSSARSTPYPFMCAPQPDVFTMTASTRSPSKASIVRRAISTARRWSPPCALSAPQHPCPVGALTSQPFFASTRAVARLCAPKTTDCTQPVSIATRPRRAPSAGVNAASGARSGPAGSGGSSDSHAGSVPGSTRTRPLLRTSVCSPLA